MVSILLNVQAPIDQLVKQFRGVSVRTFLSCLLLISMGVLAMNQAGPAESQQDRSEAHPVVPSWNQLREEESPLCSTIQREGFHYFQFKTANGSKAYLIVVDMNGPAGSKWELKPCVNFPGCGTSEAVSRERATAGVNAGFFNLNNGESTSYVVRNGKVISDPHGNPLLMTNSGLQPYIGQILNRSEARFLQDKKKHWVLQICPHNIAVSPGLTLVHSVQAGPQLLPEMTDREEAFVRKGPDGKEFDSIGVYKTAARTAFGITKDNHAMLLCVSGGKQDEYSSGVTLPDLRKLMEALGCVAALNLDGGTSTTMAMHVRDSDKDGCSYKMMCGRTPETRVKSVLLLDHRDRRGLSSNE